MENKIIDKLKIGYFADGPWSHIAFEKLIQDNSIEIAFICPRRDTRDASLMDYSKRYGIDYLEDCRINTAASHELFKSYNCDLFVSMSFNQIFKKDTIQLPRLSTINCHAGKLPFYRGRNILNWALINDEKEFGITVHFIDEGIDTGDIILQRTYSISDDDNYATLLDVAHLECANVLYDAIKLLQSGNYQRIDQKSIHPVGTYFGPRGIGDELIDWNTTSRELFNFVRAISKPGPMAHTTVEGQLVKINKVALIPNAFPYKAIVGQIVGIKGESLIVKTADTILSVEEFETDAKIRIGSRFK